MTALVELDRLVTDAAAPIPSLQALLDTGDPVLHMPAIKEMIGILNDRLSQISDAVGRLKAAGDAAMTDERKSETPGLAEVSPKFVDEAEAIVGAEASTDEALFGLWQEHERLTAQYEEATRQYGVAETTQQAIIETETPEYDTAAAAAEDAGQRQQEASDAVVATENGMARVPARTVAGALLKLRVAGAEIAGEFRGRDGALDETLLGSVERLTLSALADLERLVGTTTVAEPPPAEDAALFDALAEYDRLVAISNNLEHRKDVFRPGISEAKEADAAYEAAYDEAMEAWTRARDIPATTQAGLFAKLQATVRFMDDLKEDDLYEAEWQAIKIDVRRIAGEDSHDVSA